MRNKTMGQAAYEGYFEKCGGKSLISGAPLPKWGDQSEPIRASWEAAARAVSMSYAEEIARKDGEIAELKKRVGRALISGAESVLVERDAQIAALEKALEKAPHGPSCLHRHCSIPSHRHDGLACEPFPCNCWKSALSSVPASEPKAQPTSDGTLRPEKNGKRPGQSGALLDGSASAPRNDGIETDATSGGSVRPFEATSASRSTLASTPTAFPSEDLA